MDYENPCEDYALSAAESAVDIAKEAIEAAEAGDLEKCMELSDEADQLLDVAKFEAQDAYSVRAWAAYADAEDIVRMADDAYRALWSARWNQDINTTGDNDES